MDAGREPAGIGWAVPGAQSQIARTAGDYERPGFEAAAQSERPGLTRGIVAGAGGDSESARAAGSGANNLLRFGQSCECGPHSGVAHRRTVSRVEAAVCGAAAGGVRTGVPPVGRTSDRGLPAGAPVVES